MKIQEHEQHLQMFQKLFLNQPNINLTESNLLINEQPNAKEQIHQLPHEIDYPNQKKSEAPVIVELPLRSQGRKMFKFNQKHYLLEVLGAYIIALGLMLLNRVIYFPFFEGIIVVIASMCSKPINITNGFIMLGVPIAVLNYNLGVWILTYPIIIICYLSRFIFTAGKIKTLLWIVSAVIQLIFGFLIVGQIGNSLSKDSKIALYYLYPWMLVFVKLIVGLLNEVIEDTNLLLLQVSLFLPGLSYGMLLTLSLANIQFWYLLVLLTLDIVNTRYQVLLRLIKKVFKIKSVSIIEAHSSGYIALNHIHIIVFIYSAAGLGLYTPNIKSNVAIYLKYSWVPLTAWAFFLAYEAMCTFRLRKSEHYVILGYPQQTIPAVLLRSLALSLGLWFFFLGLGIPSVIFSSSS